MTNPTPDLFVGFLKDAEAFFVRHRTTLRRGQAYFNRLHKEFPDLAEALAATDADCFYNDDRIPAFLAKVAEHISLPMNELLTSLIQAVERQPGLGTHFYHSTTTGLCCTLGSIGVEPNGSYNGMRVSSFALALPAADRRDIENANDFGGPPDETPEERKVRMLSFLRELQSR